MRRWRIPGYCLSDLVMPGWLHLLLPVTDLGAVTIGCDFSRPGKAMYLTGDTYEGTFVEGLRAGAAWDSAAVLHSIGGAPTDA